MTTIHTIRLPLVNAFLVGGDGWIIVDAGDLLRGGFMGGRLLGGRPNPPFYIDDPAAHAASLAQALALPVTTIYVGHGGPISGEAARRRLAAGALVVAPTSRSQPVT